MTARSAEILSRLIQIDTESAKTNLPFLDVIEEMLAPHGATFRRVFDETGEKANLIATIGPADRPGYLLSGHTDVVPVAGQPWTKDPYGGEISEGRVWGRGASDMKGFLACCLNAAPKIAAADLRLPIHMVFSHDEEIGCVGVRSAVREIAEWEVTPLGCIVGEPTKMDVVIGHKAKRAVRVSFRGRTAHSSLAPKVVNAAEYAARLTTFISDIGRRLAAEGPRDPLYDVAHSTAHVGVLQAGVSVNIVPDEATMDFEIRAVGADDRNALYEEILSYAETELTPVMRAVAPEAEIVFETLSDTVGLDTEPDAEITRLAKRLAGRNDHSKVAFGTEAGLFADMAGVPSIVIGPGDIDRAHKADEYIEIAELEACDAFLERFIAHCATL